MTNRGGGIAVIGTIVCIAACLNTRIYSDAAQLDADHTWIATHYDLILDRALPLGPDRMPEGAAWLACARVVPAFEVETQMCIVKKYQGPLEAFYARPEGSSIQAQVRQLRKTHAKATPQELAGLLSIERAKITDVSRLGLLAMGLQQLELPAVPPNELLLDGTRYELEVRSHYGGRISVAISGDKTHPVIGWIEATLQALKLRDR